MTHVDPEILAGRAASDADELDSLQQAHLSSCSACAAELAELRRVVLLASSARSADLVAPPARVWQRIAEEIRAEAGSPNGRVRALPGLGDLVHPGDREHPGDLVHPGDREHPRDREQPGDRSSRRHRLPRLLAAAALGVLIGLGGALIGTRWLAPSPTVLTEVALEALPGHTGRGTAQLLRDGQQILLEVHVESAVPAGDYLELWLLDRGQTRMYPLGVLPSDGVGTYPVPPFLGDSLDGFTIVDVSLEPDDGDPAHSSDSVVRGTLPM